MASSTWEQKISANGNVNKNNDERRSNAELSLLQRQRTEVDAVYGSKTNYSFSYLRILWTFLTMLVRPFIIFYNFYLAYGYYLNGERNYAFLTYVCIIVPICLTTIIHGFMCYDDERFSQGFRQGFKTICRIIISVFIRDFNTFVYYYLCKRAELSGNKAEQEKYYKRAVDEESDTAFIGLFDCFLESAPQKILMISIIITESYAVSILQAGGVFLYFCNIAWCLSSYHCSVRIAQEDKENIDIVGRVMQVSWHLCISVSRTLCLALVASLFPLWTLLCCLLRIVLTGFVLFIADRPQCPQVSILNFFFCLCFGCIYLFTYIATREARTRNKYSIFYFVCFFENVLCIYLFVAYASSELKASSVVFYLLCSSPILFYFLGIISMILYYKCCHPTVVAKRKQKSVDSRSSRK